MPRGRRSLLIIRDMMLQGARAYKTFLECYEGIATNILADRLSEACLVDWNPTSLRFQSKELNEVPASLQSLNPMYS